MAYGREGPDSACCGTHDLIPQRPALFWGSILAGIPFLAAWVGPWIAPFDPFAIVGPSLTSSSGVHWLGTDALGRDVWSGLLWGARTSWLIGGSVGLLATALGVSIGMASAALGGWTEGLLMRTADLALALPRFFLAILVVALFGPGLDRIVAVLVLTSWAGTARIVRAEALSLNEREFAVAARAAGASRWQVATGEVLPNLLPTVLVLGGLLVGRAILIEAGLSFLGLGDPSLLSWGTMAGEANATLRSAWWLAAAPGVAIMITVVGLNLLSDTLTQGPAT